MISEIISFSTQMKTRPSFMTEVGMMSFLKSLISTCFYWLCFLEALVGDCLVGDWLPLTWFTLQQFHGGLISTAWTSFAYLARSRDCTCDLPVQVTILQRPFFSRSVVSCVTTSAFQGMMRSNTDTPGGTSLYYGCPLFKSSSPSFKFKVFCFNLCCLFLALIPCLHFLLFFLFLLCSPSKLSESKALLSAFNLPYVK